MHNTVNTNTHITKTHTHNCQNTPTYAHPHITKQVKTNTVQDTHQMKYLQYIQVPTVQGHPIAHGTFIPKNFNVTHFTSLNF